MGVERTWRKEERTALARAWIHASTDPTVGKDRTEKAFYQTVYKRFALYDADLKCLDRYGFRSVESCKQKFGEISADCQKFKPSLRKIYNANSTGVVEEDISSMAVAIHVGIVNKMDYHMSSFNQDK
ncbi:hypothetical protein FGB62_330g011 [Gracilaria domingensis]|nr:hypothetical protein FGB62_330g011 [Gracilaria domingensis]